jgi:hypothetical protein
MINKEWQIGLSSWIIQDGNYGDFKVGETETFAIEFFSEDISFSNRKEKYANLINKAAYDINAEVVFNADDFLVIDFGLLAYQEVQGKSTYTIGDWVKGNFYLGIDPFFYFENGYTIKGIQPLIYAWNIEEVLIETAPFLETQNDKGGKVLTRDESKSLLKSIPGTNAWNDDNGNAEYILKCKLNSLDASFKKQ